MEQETVIRLRQFFVSRADHAAAQDAVFSYVSDDFVKEMGFIPVQTKASTKDEYLTRPDYGRIPQKINRKSLKNFVNQIQKYKSLLVMV